MRAINCGDNFIIVVTTGHPSVNAASKPSRLLDTASDSRRCPMNSKATTNYVYT